jgi:hypothetical protein
MLEIQSLKRYSENCLYPSAIQLFQWLAMIIQSLPLLKIQPSNH